MWDRGVRLANALIDAGVRPGDRVAGLEDNNLGAADLFLGAAIAGAVRVPLYARNSPRRTVTWSARPARRWSSPTPSTPTRSRAWTRHVIVSRRGLRVVAGRAVGRRSDGQVGPDDWYVIRHSAGTTGTPKGVGYTQHDWLVNCRNWFYRLPNLRWGSVVGHAGPISHASGYLFLPAWLHGSTNLLFGASSDKVLDMVRASTASPTCSRRRRWWRCSPPTRRCAGRDLPALECMLVGGAPITDATALAGRAVFGDVLYQVFGQTEAVPLTVMTPQEWFGTCRVDADALGRPGAAVRPDADPRRGRRPCCRSARRARSGRRSRARCAGSGATTPS